MHVQNDCNINPRLWKLHISMVIMLPDGVHISQMLSSSSSTDFEYLRKFQGSVYLENVLNQNSMEFLNKDKFVSLQSVLGNTSLV